VRGYYNGSGGVLPGNRAFNNLAYGNRGGQYGNEDESVIVFGPSNWALNPAFVNRSARNFRLGAKSPARDRALITYAPGIDIAGRKRPRHQPPDLGAFER
jgi:hypothetical protein